MWFRSGMVVPDARQSPRERACPLHAGQKASYAAPGAEFIEPDGKNDAEVWVLDSPSGTWRRAAVLKEDRALSVASFKGRLYLGTGARGRIYASRKR